MSSPVASLDVPEGPRSPAEDRRAAVRRASAARAVCRVLGQDTPAWYATIHDVSHLGVGLMLRSAVSIGAVLQIALETEEGIGVRTVLARVVHVEDNGDETWLVGCAFISELGESDLRTFDAEKVRPATPDARRWVRFPCNVETVCYSSETIPGERRPVRILNISAGGVGLLCPCDFTVGTLLHLELPAEAARLALIRVVRVVEHNTGGWFLGCEFVEQLGADELLSLVK